MLAGFGVRGMPRLLTGGQGGTWRAGGVVLKRSDGAEESRWRAEALAALPPSPRFRVARPVPARAGNWLVDGWEAWQAVEGRANPTRVDEVVRAGLAFHAAVAGLPRPRFLDARDDPWAYGDRVAWDELPVPDGPASRGLLAPLVRARRPVDLPAQLVHGDLPGNVLFASSLPPAVIDWSPYWRPVSWALAVAVADALCWYGAGADAVRRWAHLPEWEQMLVRALIYRIATREAAHGPDGPGREPDEAYRRAIAAVIP